MGVEEKKLLRALQKSVKKAFENNEKVTPQAILALASYKALYKYNWHQNLIAA